MVCERDITTSPHQLVFVTGPGRVTSSVIHPNSFQPTPVGLSFNWAWIRRPYTVGEREELIILTNLIANLHLNAEEDIWEFTYGASRSFTTHCMRNLITLNSYSSNLQPKRWNKILPAKVNILSWRVWHRRIPTRLNLDCWGTDLDTVRCPVCDDDTKSEEQIFINCKASSDTWKAIFSWWKISGPPITSVDDMISLADRAPIASNQSKYFDVVVHATIWHLWNYRNKVTFSVKRLSKDFICNDIKLSSFTWISSRSKKTSLNWLDWSCNPCNALSSSSSL
ncbi:RNA-directed DNA polymerase, eukaryota, reverse transcriptase zinc-binding domain protein [Tanacetum coccineum]|uniref:RNA-directed DNA polymerase, eukaryota, reverse transcriptase zinc-binding domain protein n=1 Tax=Tanacetum coccineum TaxID=301880 RepID=A0ABQ5G389_9ASTR